jgi:hypothetical protein
MYWKYSLLWLGLAVLGVINGVLRNALYADLCGELAAHQLSTLILMILLTGYTWVFSLIWKPQSARQAFIIGVIWLVLTVAFEFIFGHYYVGHPWPSLFYDYNLLAGRIWILLLIWALFVPLVVYKLRVRS